MVTPVSITAIASFSPLGVDPEGVWQQYLDTDSLIKSNVVGGKNVPTAALSGALVQEVEVLKNSNPNYKSLDKSVLYAMLASRQAVQRSGWGTDDIFGVNIGSSRGATELFENHFEEFLQTGKTAVQASPATTLGNISSWVAQDLKSNGPDISHSITCSTALHALLNGVAWLRAGMATKFLVGGSEAPLTPFTIAQMQAMKIYSNSTDAYPCRALDLDKTQSSMVLGEGAGMACLELGYVPDALAYVEGIGYATEVLKHSVSISAEADCMQKSMRMALEGIDPNDIDAVVMHAPGTVKGDTSEYAAVQQVFGTNLPLLTTNKWKIGHTFGASGLLSLEFAVMMLQHNHFIPSPFMPQQEGRPLKKILVNAVGFGGNAVSVVVSK
ncbi:beta-ketoacyl synthase N-terminal-like domain-containing protein [Flavobacterium subsaxonicum]|uniref:Beta-ketoacyl synthase n=1 Tax=Flavobacterium subsaxonicum WB 4.1-42 = DSM 21790 TaxID=1121898 RepID=A0A0A2MEM8_9FLAO|nr:beta-ketoacyl synthase N-terminal-like domain-containing protein [Flavobacterium subsaxonicum]KGO91132.1 beta-ketoacyl synthase [Flavobacterium subsaxonicum WB 4.1-42 = DSM 21790]